MIGVLIVALFALAVCASLWDEYRDRTQTAQQRRSDSQASTQRLLRELQRHVDDDGDTSRWSR